MKEHTDLSYAPFFPRLAALALDHLFLFFALLIPDMSYSFPNAVSLPRRDSGTV